MWWNYIPGTVLMEKFCPITPSQRFLSGRSCQWRLCSGGEGYPFLICQRFNWIHMWTV